MAQFVTHQEQLQAINIQVVTISFGTPYWANVWLSETSSPYPLLLDQTHQSYKAYGLESSMLKSWSIKTMLYYAEAFLKGEKFKEDRGNTHQLGGDFIVDKNGICRFAHPSQDPTDRPKIETIPELLSA